MVIIGVMMRISIKIYFDTADVKTARLMLKQLPISCLSQTPDEYSSNGFLTHSVVINHYPAADNMPYGKSCSYRSIPQCKKSQSSLGLVLILRIYF